MVEGRSLRVAAVGDLHVGKVSQGALHTLFGPLAGRADVLLLAGDLTDYGLPEEARVLARELTAVVKIPTLAVLGNHDYQSGKQDEVREILHHAGVTVLDGDVAEVQGVGFAGVKGFAGGFGRHTLEPWGEDPLKNFVRVAVDEALKLEAALSRLRTEHRVALLHYAPIQETVEGEPREIFPFLGCSRLEEPINRYEVAAVFHGHAHRGPGRGHTSARIPVYNVSLPLLRAQSPDAPFRIVEIPSPGIPPQVAQSVS